MATDNNITQQLREKFDGIVESEFRGERRIDLPSEILFEALKYLKENGPFDMLVDITCVDCLHYRGSLDRFRLIYQLADTSTNQRLTVRCGQNEPNLAVKSVVSLWETANWLEREVWDMFGMDFTGHPDLRRILLPENFTSYPLRKDYPLQGRGERHHFPVLGRSEG